MAQREDNTFLPRGWIFIWAINCSNIWEEGEFLTQDWQASLIFFLCVGFIGWKETIFLPQGLIFMMLESFYGWEEGNFLPQGWLDGAWFSCLVDLEYKEDSGQESSLWPPPGQLLNVDTAPL